MEQEQKYFASPDGSGLLNSDDAPFSIGANAWVNAENVRTESTDKGFVNEMESVGSNVLRSVVQPSVTFITIGTADDIPNNRFFIFKYNTTGQNHKITYYDINTQTEYDVLLSSQVTSGLNFNKDYPIHSARVVDDLLYWTDNYNEPRRINVNAAIKLNNPAYVTDEAAYTAPLNQSVITIIRRPPGRILGVTPVTTVGRENFIKKFAGQFAIGYVYRDGEESVFSPPSQMINYRLEVNNPSGVVSDNSNGIQMDINTPSVDGEFIDQDVQIVQFAVRFNNTSQYFIIKEWDKDNSTEAAQIAAYNAGGSLSYTFYNDKIGIPVSLNRSVKSSDSVPVLSQTLETGLNRLFLGGNTAGYDVPATTSLLATAALNGAITIGSPIFKSYSTYQIGIRFRDNYKRQCSVVTKNNLVIQVPDRGDWDSATGFYDSINWSLSNALAATEIPDWAYYYDILITKNLRTRFFVQWLSNTFKYSIKNANGTFAYQTNYGVGVNGIAVAKAWLGQQGQSLIFTEGDLLRVSFNNLTPTTVTLAVTEITEDYVICAPQDLGNTSTFTGIFCEYYTPYRQSGEEPFYTCGNSFRVSAPTTSARVYSVTSGVIGGDCFWIPRQAIFITSATYYTEAMSPNDNMWKNWFDIFGEQNFVSLLGQVNKKTSVKWSNTKIEGTQSNGLSTFDALDEKLLPLDCGAVRKLQQTSKIEAQGNIMLAVCEKETASLYLGEVQTYGGDQQLAPVNTIDNVIGTVNILKGSFGTVNPESVTEYRGRVYWLDANNGRVIQYSENGLFPISNYKMTRFWKLWSQQYLSMTAAQVEALGGRPFVFMVVDPRHEELLISLPKLSNTPPNGYLPDYPSTIYPFDIYDLQAKTLVYQLQIGDGIPKWKGAYTFYAENFIAIQNNYYSFKQGHIWEHNQTNTTNNFYGVQYPSKIMFVANQEPTHPKVYNNLVVQANLVPTFVYFYNNEPIQQASDLVDFSFRNYEGNWAATILRNKLVPTATSFDTTGLLTGEKMRNVAMFAMVQFSPTTTFLQLKNVNLGYIRSLGNTVP